MRFPAVRPRGSSRTLALTLGVLAAAAIGFLFALSGQIGATDSVGTTERVSVDSAANQADNDSFRPAISADGRFVAFQSTASNLVPSDTCCEDIFVHDRQSGATERVSVDSAGGQANGWSTWPAISADGRYVAFASGASNLVPGDTNAVYDVFVHDRETGITERVSVDSAAEEGNGDSGSSALDSRIPLDISADGRFVAFNSKATNLVSHDTNVCGVTPTWNCPDVFVHDRQTGTTERVSVDSAGYQVDADSYGAAISADGRYVAFVSSAYDLVQGDTNGCLDVFLHDSLTGVTERVSLDYLGNQATGSPSTYPSISADGRYVAFSSWAHLVPDDLPGKDVFVRDRVAGVTELVSGSEPSVSDSDEPAMSADGRFVAFISGSPTLVPGDTNNAIDVFVRDRQTGTVDRVSVASDGTEGDGGSLFPSISADGRYVAFHSRATNLVGTDTDGDTICDVGCDTNNAYDIFVRDRETGITERVSVGTPTPEPPTPEPPTPEPFVYIAAGDSVPAGVDLGTECVNDPWCHAGPSKAYPAALLDSLNGLPELGTVALENIACSGASSADYRYGDSIEHDSESECGASEGKSQLDYVLSLPTTPDLVTITVGADDYVLPKLMDCFWELVGSGRLFRARACADRVLANEDPYLEEFAGNLDHILTVLESASYPDGLVVVTNYYNPLPSSVSPASCALAAAQHPFLGAACLVLVRESNRILSDVNRLILDLNAEIASVVVPHTASSGGRVVLADLYSQFEGHCASIDFTLSARLGRWTWSATLPVGCSSDESWMASWHKLPDEVDIRLGRLGATAVLTHTGVHPNEAGQQCIANVIWEDIKGPLGSAEPPIADPCP